MGNIKIKARQPARRKRWQARSMRGFYPQQCMVYFKEFGGWNAGD